MDFTLHPSLPVFTRSRGRDWVREEVLSFFWLVFFADKLKADLSEKEVQRKYSADAAKRKVSTVLLLLGPLIGPAIMHPSSHAEKGWLLMSAQLPQAACMANQCHPILLVASWAECNAVFVGYVVACHNHSLHYKARSICCNVAFGKIWVLQLFFCMRRGTQFCTLRVLVGFRHRIKEHLSPC